jgi:PRTRC genetic system protein E
MFKELAPLVRHRAVLFTVTYLEDDQFRVNVIPKKVSDGENNALTTPVSVTGTVEDLDRELPGTLLHFVSSHLGLKNSLDRAKAEMEEASKAARDEAKKKSGNQTLKKKGGDSGTAAPAPEALLPAKAESPGAAGLFDSAPDPQPRRKLDAPAAGDLRNSSGVPEPGEDEEILREAYEGEEDPEEVEGA